MLALGTVLLLVGLSVLVLEAHVSTAGLLGGAGVMAAAAGMGLIIAALGATLVVAVPVSVVAAGAGLTALTVTAHKVLLARQQDVRTGPSCLIGATATVRTWSDTEGQVIADGTLWSARASWGWEDPPPAPGDTVVINELVGLTVSIRRPHPWEVPPVWVPSSLSL